jgi:SAM-dependent methyltransferase
VDGGATRCPLCAGELHSTSVHAFDRLVTGDGPFTVLECRDCQYGVSDPQLRGEALARYYGAAYCDGYYGHAGPPPSGWLERARARFRVRAAQRRFERPPFALPDTPPGRVLDVGCGSGELLERYAKLGWQTFGVDPSPSAAAAARRRGATVHVGTLGDHPWPAASFELITFSHSLEHIPEPLEALRAARLLLVPGGLIAIALPNWRSWQRRFLFRSRWAHLDLPRHLQHFSPRALQRSAALLDLDALQIGTSSTVISVAYSLHYLLAGHWTPGWKLWLSYALGAVAFPPAAALNKIVGGDCCYALLARTASGEQQPAAEGAATL